MRDVQNAAEALEGRILPEGWTVLERISPPADGTGGNFSVNYRVSNADGRAGFCKVLNYHWLFQALDPLDAIAEAAVIYRFERDLARDCVALSRVVSAIDDGMFTLAGFEVPYVSYIIFEMADRDIRGFLNRNEDLDLVARLRFLHNIASGLRQLHGRGVAHQDLKPSNALVFPPTLSGVRLTKVGDLGRASVRGRPMRHDEFSVAGDPAYAPIEALYGAVPADFAARRMGCDIYQLGSMVSFVLVGVTINSLLLQELHPSHHPRNWAGSYNEVLAYVQDAFDRSLERIESGIREDIGPRAVDLIRQLCDPDLSRRGHRGEAASNHNQFALDRVVTELDLLSRRASLRKAG